MLSTIKTVNHNSCPLCLNTSLTPYFSDKCRDYFLCTCCDLVSVPKHQYLSVEQEKAEYDKHNNHIADEGYRRFLNRTWQPLLNTLKARNDIANITGLDFGCGEGAVLSQIIKEDGIHVSNYDLYYHFNEQLLRQRYDFITLTEVIEHIASPHNLILQLQSMLKTNGILAIMTKRVKDKISFSRWHYKNDLTHISFYSVNTFKWIASRYDFKLKLIDNDVVFLSH